MNAIVNNSTWSPNRATVLLALFVCSAARTAGADNAVADFSNTTNTDTSTWSYRYSPTDVNRDGNYDLLTVHSDTRPYWNPPTPYWGPAPGGIPGVGVNRSGSPIPNASDLPQFTWPDGTIWMHPPAGNTLAVVSWLSPLSGLVDIGFTFSDLDPNGGNGIAYYVDRNDSTGQLAGGTLANGGSSGSLSLTNVAVNIGDRIHFIVDPGAGGNADFDSTALTAIITPIPEPTSFLLWLVGMAGMASRRRPNRQRGTEGRDE
jgi:hypothetical protein